MFQFLRVFAPAIGLAMFVAAALQPAEARREIIARAGNCYVISSSYHGTSPPKALRQAQGDLDIAVRRIIRKEGWKNPRWAPQRVTPNPTLRSSVPGNILIKPDVRTARSYTQCWPGVIWPYVCTSGARLCPR